MNDVASQFFELWHTELKFFLNCKSLHSNPDASCYLFSCTFKDLCEPRSELKMTELLGQSGNRGMQVERDLYFWL